MNFDIFFRNTTTGPTNIRQPNRIRKHGPEFGLTVVLNQRHDDYAFAMHSIIGIRIMIYSSENFADQISNAVKEKFINAGDEMFLTLLAVPVEGASAMRQYSKESRHCVFPDEIKLVFKE